MKIYGDNDGRVGMAMCSLAHALCAKGNLCLNTEMKIGKLLLSL